MTNRLIRFETRLLWRSFADAFSRPRDRLLLLMVAIIGACWLRARLADATVPGLPARAAWAGLLGLPAGAAAQRVLAARLAWLAEESPLSAIARQGRARRTYLALFHGLSAGGVAAAALWIGAAAGRPMLAPVLGLGSYAAGMAAGRAWPPGDDRRRGAMNRPRPIQRRWHATRSGAMFRAIVAHQTRDRSDPMRGAALVLGATFLATLGAGLMPGSWREPARVAAMAAPALLALLWTGRVEASLLGFLPSLGYGPGATGLAVSALPFGCIAVAELAIALAHPSGGLAGAAIVAIAGTGVLLVELARAWLSPGRSGRSIDLQVGIELAAALLIGFILPPLAPVIVAGRFVLLCRRAASRCWVQL